MDFATCDITEINTHLFMHLNIHRVFRNVCCIVVVYVHRSRGPKIRSGGGRGRGWGIAMFINTGIDLCF